MPWQRYALSKGSCLSMTSCYSFLRCERGQSCITIGVKANTSVPLLSVDLPTAMIMLFLAYSYFSQEL